MRLQTVRRLGELTRHAFTWMQSGADLHRPCRDQRAIALAPMMLWHLKPVALGCWQRARQCGRRVAQCESSQNQLRSIPRPRPSPEADQPQRLSRALATEAGVAPIRLT